jgi:hypothetical protein
VLSKIASLVSICVGFLTILTWSNSNPALMEKYYIFLNNTLFNSFTYLNSAFLNNLTYFPNSSLDLPKLNFSVYSSINFNIHSWYIALGIIFVFMVLEVLTPGDDLVTVIGSGFILGLLLNAVYLIMSYLYSPIWLILGTIVAIILTVYDDGNWSTDGWDETFFSIIGVLAVLGISLKVLIYILKLAWIGYSVS